MNDHFRKCVRNRQGVTLPELLVAVFILAIAFVGTLLTYVKCIELNELSRNATIALAAAKNKMIEIQNIPSNQFDQIIGNYNGVSFTTPNFDGRGVTYVSSTNTDLLKVTVSLCWRQKNGRMLGEDQNLSGTINAGEDLNGNGILDSPIELVTSIYR